MTVETYQARRRRRTVGLPAGPARRALIEYARRGQLQLDEVADVLHLDDGDVPAVVHERRVPWPVADRIAIALGHHPYELWPEWFSDVDDADVPPEGQGGLR